MHSKIKKVHIKYYKNYKKNQKTAGNFVEDYKKLYTNYGTLFN